MALVPDQDVRKSRAMKSRRSSWQRLVDAFFGYDFFISYTHADGKDYARPLARCLEKQYRFDCFLDVQDYRSGDNWQVIGEWALKRTGIMVMVGSPKAFESKPVLREVRIFSGTGKRIIPIDFGRTFTQLLARGNPLSKYIAPEVLRVDEPLESLETGPTEDALKRIADAFHGTRQSVRRRK